jgi:hypothetical protein
MGIGDWILTAFGVFIIGCIINLDQGTIVRHYACDCKDAYGYMPYQTEPPICGHCQQPMKEFYDE